MTVLFVCIILRLQSNLITDSEFALGLERRVIVVRENADIEAKRRRVDFVFHSDEAEEVFLMGDFNDWSPQSHPMKRDEDGVWRKFLFLFPGTYEYKLFADGCWCMDPENPLTCPNCFGSRNNFVVIG